MGEVTNLENPINRKQLIPLWIKIATCFFIFVTIVSLVAIPLSSYRFVHLDLYGFSHSAQGISLEMIGITIISLLITLGFIGIMTTKEWGPNYLFVIGICLLVFFLLRFIGSVISGPLEIRVEPFIISIFLFKIQGIRRNWSIQ